MTTAAIAVVYVACVTVLNLVVSAHLTAQADGRLGARLDELRKHPAEVARQVSRPGIASDGDDDDGDDLTGHRLAGGRRTGRVVASTPGAPALPAEPDRQRPERADAHRGPGRVRSRSA